MFVELVLTLCSNNWAQVASWMLSMNFILWPWGRRSRNLISLEISFPHLVKTLLSFGNRAASGFEVQFHEQMQRAYTALVYLYMKEYAHNIHIYIYIYIIYYTAKGCCERLRRHHQRQASPHCCTVPGPLQFRQTCQGNPGKAVESKQKPWSFSTTWPKYGWSADHPTLSELEGWKGTVWPEGYRQELLWFEHPDGRWQQRNRVSSPVIKPLLYNVYTSGCIAMRNLLGSSTIGGYRRYVAILKLPRPCSGDGGVGLLINIETSINSKAFKAPHAAGAELD